MTNSNQLPSEKLNQSELIKKEAKSSSKYGCPPEKRTIKKLIDYGIININKPSGPSSHLISDYVQKILNIQKSGHSGTLDPKVTGVLPIALSKATRIVQTLLPSGKEYIATMRLHDKIEEKQIEKTFKKFIGEIKQLPPNINKDIAINKFEKRGSEDAYREVMINQLRNKKFQIFFC